MLSRRVTPETVCLTSLCMVDLATTLYWVLAGHAHEANPWLAHCLALHPALFVAAKTASFLPALAAAEWYRQHNPALVLRALRGTTCAYVGLYLGALAALHLP